MIQDILNHIENTFIEDNFHITSQSENKATVAIGSVEFKLTITKKVLIIRVSGLQEVSIKLDDISLMDKVEGTILGSILKFI